MVDHAATEYGVGLGATGKPPAIKEFEATFGYNRAATALYNARLKPALGDKASPALTAVFASLATVVTSPTPPEKPDLKAMSHMYRRAWRSGLKTTYYLRTLGASRIEGPTVARVAAAACSIEAARNGEECEACQ